MVYFHSNPLPDTNWEELLNKKQEAKAKEEKLGKSCMYLSLTRGGIR